MKNIICLASLLWIGTSAFNYAVADNVSLEQQLEQAIYTEEVLGDLDKATQLYQRIISDGHQSRTLVANALLRLAQCQKKLGDHAAASETFLRIKRDYADIEPVISSVKLIEAAQAEKTLSLKPVPWKDGEILEYAAYDANGNVSLYETQVMTYMSGETGAPQSKREFFTLWAASKNASYNASIIDNKSGDLVSQRRQSVYDKGVFIKANNGTIILENKNTGKFFEAKKDPDAVDGALFSEILRRLPYQLGYKETLKAFNLDSLTHAEVVIEVINDNARISVPAGEFDAYHIRYEWFINGQSINPSESWISKDDDSKIVQTTANGITVKLLKDNSLALTETTRFQYRDAFELTLPKRWAMFDMTMGKSKEMVLVPTHFEAQKFSARITSKYEGETDWKKEPITTVATWNIDFSKGYYKHFAVREETRKNFKIGNLPAYSYVADFKNGDIDLIEYRIIVLKAPIVHQAYFHIQKDEFESVKSDIDAMFSSLKIIEQ